MILRSRGQGLIGAMVAAAIVAGLGIYIAKISNTSSQTVKGAKSSLELQVFEARIVKALTKRDLCTAYLGGHSVNDPTDINDNLPPFMNGAISLMAVGQDIPGSAYTVREIKFLNDATNGEHVFVNLEKTSQNRGFTPTSLVRRFSIDVTYSDVTPTEIEQCHSLDDDTISTATQIACEDFLGGEFNEETNICENSSFCELEKFQMRMQGLSGETTCGESYQVVDVTQIVDTSRTISIPSGIVANQLYVNLLGGGAGGHYGGRDGNGYGGDAGEVVLGSLNVRDSSCSIVIGSGGTTGVDGGNTSIACGGEILMIAKGGKSGNRHGGDRCGRRGQSVLFRGVVRNGGAGRCRTSSGGSNGQRGAGGGGGAKGRNISSWRKQGTNGGAGLVFVSYKVLTLVQ